MACSSDPQKVAAWRERFVRLEASGLKTAEFCAAEGVSIASFYAWRRKLGLSPTRQQSTNPACVGIPARASSSKCSSTRRRRIRPSAWRRSA